MASRQFFIPSGVMPISGVFMNADSNGREFFIPGLGMFNEAAAAAVAADVPNLVMAPYLPT